MGRSSLRAALITSDPEVRTTVMEFGRGSGGVLSVILDLDTALEGFTGAQFKSVQQAAPALVFIDFESSPELGVSLARDLNRATDELVLVGIGPELGAEQLLQAMRAGLAEYLSKPVSVGSLAEAVERLRPRIAPLLEEAGSQGRILAFVGSKGGSGNSTAVTNLAVEVRRRTAAPTLIVDLDQELGEIALLLGVQPQFNFVDLVQNFARMDSELLSTYIEQHSSGVHLLSAPFHPVRPGKVTADNIRQILYYLRGQYQYVLVDVPKSFSPETIAAFEQADEIFLVTTLDLPSLRNIQRVLPMLRRALPAGDERLHLIVNRYSPEGEVGLKDVEKTLGLPIHATLANDYEAVIRSLNSGRPVVLNGAGRRSPYARDVRALAARIAQVDVERTAEMRTPGLLGRLLGRKPGAGSPRRGSPGG